MTRQFIKRSAIAAVLLTLGLAFVCGDNSFFDKVISDFNSLAVWIVLTLLVTFWTALALWVVLALKPTKWAQNQTSHGKAASLIAVIAAGIIGAPLPSRAMIGYANTIQAAQINQPLALSADAQSQVDRAIAEASEGAKEQPGFVVTVELAIGIFIAAVLVGTTLYIIVRTICKSYERIREDLQRRMAKLKEFLIDPGSNQPVVLGAALFHHRPATTNELQKGAELQVGFVATEPTTLTGTIASDDKITLGEFMSDFGVTDKWPLDSTVGDGMSRVNDDYQVAPSGFTNLVTLSFESATNLVQQAWSKALTIRVPEGAVVDFADLTGNSDGRYWRVGVAQ